MKVGVLFICLGNICRSPLAEGVFRHLAERRGVAHHFDIDSAGTSGYHDGEGPDPRTTAVAHARGVVLQGRSRRLTAEDVERFDHLIVMDRDNLSAVRALAERLHARPEIRLLREFDQEARGALDVPDPYFGGARGFEDVHDIVERACGRLLDELIARHDLA